MNDFISHFQSSIAEGLSETLKMLSTVASSQRRPLYVVIVHVSRQRGTEFCIVVVGKYTDHYLLLLCPYIVAKRNGIL